MVSKKIVKLTFVLILLIMKAVESIPFQAIERYKVKHPKLIRHVFNNLRLCPPQLIDEISEEAPHIPKIIHQIWIGSPLPEKFEKMTESWKEKHLDWTYILWTDEEVKKLKLVNQLQFDKAPNLGAKADILRYELLERFGGVYVDIDYECIKPFDQLHYGCEFYCCALGENVIANALIGCVPHHPILQICVKRIKHANIETNNFQKILEMVGPIFFTRCILDYWSLTIDKNLKIFTPEFSFPMSSSRRFDYWNGLITEAELETYRNSSAFAIHYWATSWQTK